MSRTADELTEHLRELLKARDEDEALDAIKGLRLYMRENDSEAREPVRTLRPAIRHPSVGDWHRYRNLTYTCTAVEPYTKQLDGIASYLTLWQGPCRRCRQQHQFQVGSA